MLSYILLFYILFATLFCTYVTLFIRMNYGSPSFQLTMGLDITFSDCVSCKGFKINVSYIYVCIVWSAYLVTSYDTLWSDLVTIVPLLLLALDLHCKTMQHDYPAVNYYLQHYHTPCRCSEHIISLCEEMSYL